MKKQLKRLRRKLPKQQEPMGLEWFHPETGKVTFRLSWKPDGKGGWEPVHENFDVDSPEQK